ncbi:MAG: SdpI family protein [Phycisphaerales bacterium]|nr:SdpI family protein [Phycisphaerales bacterium]
MLANFFLAGVCLCSAFLYVGLAIPLIRRRVGPNPLYGIRLRQAFLSEAHWFALNAFGGRWLLIWAIPLAAIGVTLVVSPPISGSVPLILLAAFAPAIILVPWMIQVVHHARRLERDECRLVHETATRPASD